MTTLKELIVKRPSRQFQYLHVLLDLSSHEKEKVPIFTTWSVSSSLIFSPKWISHFLVLCFSPGQDYCPGFSEKNVWERSSQGLYWEVCPELHAITCPSQPSISALWGWQGHRWGTSFVNKISYGGHGQLFFLALLPSFKNNHGWPQCFVLDTEVAAPWTEDTVRQCLFLYLSLLPLNHQLVHELASVYTEAIADIKRSVLRAIEQPVSLSPLK